MRPSRRLLVLLGILFALGLLVAFLPALQGIVFLGGAVVGALALVDALGLMWPRDIFFERVLPSRFALGHVTKIPFRLINRSPLPIRLRFFDGVPEVARYEDLPSSLHTLRGRERVDSFYRVTFLKRGDIVIERGWVEFSSLLGLWWRERRVGEAESIKVYPDYVPALQYGLLATADRAEQMGIVKPRHKGMSKEFHQLRDYQVGDGLSQIDWKATSRFNKLITREFQEERDQTILLVLDSSMRTRAIDGELPIFDHLLNAALLFSYIALKQGDKVGVMNFGGTERYLAPVRGTSGMSRILNHLYNYESSTAYGDYADLASRVLTVQRKRALVVVLTNLRSEDLHGAVDGLQLLRRKHLVLVASVRESVVEDSLKEPILRLEDARRYVGALAYLQDTLEIVNEFRAAGMTTIHESLATYPIALANQYLDLRASGRW